MWQGSENLKLDIDAHPSKHCEPTYSTDEGRQIGPSAGQPKKTPCCIRTNFESAGNITVASLRQWQKQSNPISSIDDGIIMDSNPHSEKVMDVKHRNCESGPNETARSEEHCRKHSFSIDTTDDGM
jgi:hypothetical protein